MVSFSVVFGDVVRGVAVSGRSFVLSQSRVQVSPSLTDIGRVTVVTLYSAYHPLSVWGWSLSLTLAGNFGGIGIGLWATRMSYGRKMLAVCLRGAPDVR